MDPSEPGQFPVYKDGDVYFVLSPHHAYQFHSGTLRLHSSLLAKLLTDDTAAPLSAKSRRDGIRVRWRVELVLPDHPDQGRGTLILRPLDERARPIGAPPDHWTRSLDAGTLPADHFHHWENLLKTFYSQPIVIRTADGIGPVLCDIIGLTEVAEYCGSMSVVALPLDNALIRQGQLLWQSVARNPAAWADLAIRVRSELVFREAVAHLVGQWPRMLHNASREVAKLDTEEDTAVSDDIDGLPAISMKSAANLIASLQPEVRELCRRKHEALTKFKADMELNLMSYYPTHLHRNGGIGAPSAGGPMLFPNVTTGSVTVRNSGHSVTAAAYGKDVLGWMALNLFRHFIGQMIIGDQGARAIDGGYSFYAALARGGDAYLDRNATEHFTISFPLSAKARALFEEQLLLIKEGVRRYADPLLVSTLALDEKLAEAAGLRCKYLKCARLKRSEMPWVVRGRGNKGHDLPWPADCLDRAAAPAAPSPGPSDLLGFFAALDDGSAPAVPAASPELPAPKPRKGAPAARAPKAKRQRALSPQTQREPTPIPPSSPPPAPPKAKKKRAAPQKQHSPTPPSEPRSDSDDAELPLALDSVFAESWFADLTGDHDGMLGAEDAEDTAPTHTAADADGYNEDLFVAE